MSARRTNLDAALCRALLRHAKYDAATGEDPATRYIVVGVVWGF
ncbi:hypothetical protein [uncultured Sphingomonas sp.]